MITRSNLVVPRLSILAALALAVAGCSGERAGGGPSGGDSTSDGSGASSSSVGGTGGGVAPTTGSGGGGATGGTGGGASPSSTAGSGGGGTSSTGASTGAGATSAASSSSSSSSGGTGGGATGTDYAPYFYTWGWGDTSYAFTSLVDMKNKSGPLGVTLAFVLSDGGCSPTQDIQQNQADVDAYQAAGGKVKASFGGADGTYLENACSDAASLATAMGAFVDQTGITDLDFDVEQDGAVTAAVNALRATAMKTLQDQKHVKVSFTLPAVPRDPQNNPGGLSSDYVAMLTAVVEAGVTVSHVNLMTMDYGSYYSSGKAMGDLAVSALTDCKTQLQAIYPALGDAELWAMLGATPMIGQNDVSTEVFKLTDAQTLTTFAKQNHLGLVSFWAIQRDQPGSGDLGLYSDVDTAVFDFHDVFKAVAP